MFVESAKYELFAVEFKKSFNELINGLKQIWYDYDFNGVYTDYTTKKH